MQMIVYALLIVTLIPGLIGIKPGKIKPSDLQKLTGAQWKGTLTYLDYQRNKKVSIPSDLTVTESSQDKFTFIFDFQYPDEPKANSKDNVTITKDGKSISGEMLVEKTVLPDKSIKIVTEKSGTDNDRQSLFRFTYLIAKESFSIKKEVRYDGTTEFFERNQYVWKR